MTKTSFTRTMYVALWLASAVLIPFNSPGLPPTASLEERAAFIKLELPDGKPREGALLEMPDLPELLELSNRLHSLRAQIQLLPDTESQVFAREWLSSGATAKAMETFGPNDADRDPTGTHIDRFYHGTVRESIVNRSGAFESSSLTEIDTKSPNRALVQRNQSVVGTTLTESTMIGGTSTPMLMAPSVETRHVPRGITRHSLSAGPAIVAESLLSEAIRSAHGDSVAGISLRGASIVKSSPRPGIDRYDLELEVGLAANSERVRRYVFEFDQNQGGSLTYFQDLPTLKSIANPGLGKGWVLEYARHEHDGSEVWLPKTANYFMQMRLKKTEPAFTAMRFNREFYNTTFYTSRLPESAFKPGWTLASNEDNPRMTYGGRVITDPAEIRALFTEFSADLAHPEPITQ